MISDHIKLPVQIPIHIVLLSARPVHKKLNEGQSQGTENPNGAHMTPTDYRQTAIPAALRLRPYMVGPPPLAQPTEVPAWGI